MITTSNGLCVFDHVFDHSLWSRLKTWTRAGTGSKMGWSWKPSTRSTSQPSASPPSKRSAVPPRNAEQYRVVPRLTQLGSVPSQVLADGFLMIGIDGSEAVDGSDWFCYHSTSPSIFPVGFCEINNIELTPPKGTEPLSCNRACSQGLFGLSCCDHSALQGTLNYHSNGLTTSEKQDR